MTVDAATFDPASAAEALWAKSDRDGEPPVSLLAHSRAAGVAARALLGGPLAPAVHVLAQGFGLTDAQAVDLAVVMVALHDLGKATPGFQRAWDEGEARARDAALPFPDHRSYAKHGFVSAGELEGLLRGVGARKPDARRIACAVGAHHGVFPGVAAAVADDGEDPDHRWKAARTALVRWVVDEFAQGSLPCPSRSDDAAVAVLAGLATFADWLASDRSVLGRLAADGMADDAVNEALSRVPIAAPVRPEGAAFTDLFPFAPRGGQVVVDAEVVPEILGGARTLTVIEDATGAGKTEAAFQVIAASMRAGGRGAYVALPTRATSNQAYRRLLAFLSQNMPGISQALLLHSSAVMTGDYDAVRRGGHAVSPSRVDEQEDRVGVEAPRWFCQSKRGLLASFAVGTVDQAMLSVLRTKFATLRLVGLTGKTLVLDEVHAYDSYMLAIIERLVGWAGAMGSNVVLLSATLPGDMKRRLVAAFGADQPLGEADAMAYPSVTQVARGAAPRTFTVQAAERSRRSVGLLRVRLPADGDPSGVCIDLVRDAVDAGANVAVILNTVRRAQDAYQALRSVVGDERSHLLHARFRMSDREHREQRVLGLFGADGARPRGSVLVSTQVVEQSLDVDFDLIVTDLAPVDLLLQRMGRLQRHHRPGQRPAGYDEDHCRLVLLDPARDGGVPTPDRGTAAVYHPHALVRTVLALDGRDRIDVPGDVRALVEAVYDGREPPPELPPALRRVWLESADDLDGLTHRMDGMAHNRVIGRPGDRQLNVELSGSVGTDDTAGLGGFAQTRLGFSCAAVVLRPDEFARLGEADATVPRVATALLERSVSISNPGLAGELVRQGPPPHWARAPLLSHHRLIRLADDGHAVLGNAVLHLDDDLGLVIDWPER